MMKGVQAKLYNEEGCMLADCRFIIFGFDPLERRDLHGSETSRFCCFLKEKPGDS
jgi:hypothetical protein